jgi:quercetin dioxygenase-like cupin family protein
MKQAFLVAAALSAALPSTMPAALAQGHAGHVVVTPADLKWSDVPSLPPGAQVSVIEGPLNEARPFTFRLRLPANYHVPAHSHPAIERVTVLSGTFIVGMGDKADRSQARALPAGSVTIMPPGMAHYVWTDQETVVQLNGTGPWSVTYVNPADDPRKKP